MSERLVPALQAELAEILGTANLIVDRDRLLSYERDWTGRFHGAPLCALRPASTEQVASALRCCGRAGLHVVVQGGNTGLVGGATPYDGEVVLDTTRLAKVGEVDLRSRQLTVDAGVTLDAAQEHARRAGLDVAVDLAARSRATIGGMVATNAGGALALRYGTMRASVVGLEAVLADGSVITRLGGLVKDNAGYDLPALLIGSEGTLAVITRVRLTLVKRPRDRAVALMGVAGFQEALDVMAELSGRLGLALEAAECFDRLGMELVCAYGQVRDPLSVAHPLYVLIQVADELDAISRLAEALPDGGSEQMAVGDGDARTRALWSYRERLNEAVGAHAPAHKYDVSVPLGAIPQLAATAREQIAALDPHAQIVIYGHLGDGNLHLNVLGFALESAYLDEAVLVLVAAHGGSISAEHGIGRAKRAMLTPTRSIEEIEAMRAIKRALDPGGMLGVDRVLETGLGLGADRAAAFSTQEYDAGPAVEVRASL